jgi:Protein of unknown function (DUF2789)
MESQLHSMTALFNQLGLPSDEASIAAFVRKHAPLPEGVALQDAAFWSPSQRALLHSGLCVDADWANVIDQLNLQLSSVR